MTMTRKPTPQLRSSDDPLWYKDAIIYQLHVKSFFDANNDGVGDFAGLIAEARLYREPRRQRDLAAAVLSLAAARRRLRHRRLSRRHPDYGTLGGRSRRFVASRARARHPRHHRARHQPHLRPASLVPARPRGAKPGSRRARLLCLVRHRPEISPKPGSSSSTPRSRTGPGIRWPTPISGTASTRTSPT